ncbi:capsular biosynthesis protein [Pseudomonas sp. SG20056]|uniref:capsular polysaccharide export protein, LipB/KpsS family n=1 Tax=Pseudomonas sp. SG20056 TaxID=3074146 RepID=UPI00287FF245|nr:capsular biosynthesis protein [Pseudomonas sp. SG20056]WNF46343.1 capsular biosynthesis protein [Pseudomonas sp. SG20056]
MGKVLFFSLAKHQTRYFGRLLAETSLQGLLVESGRLPFPALSCISQVVKKVDWIKIVAEKCQERKVKRKYHGMLYRLLLRAELFFMGLRIQALLNRENPDLVAVWNGAARHCQLLLALLKPGSKAVFFENGLLPNTTTFDPRGVNYNNSMPRTAAFYRAYAEQQAVVSAVPVKLVPRKPRIVGLESISLPERFVFIPFQDDRDTQVRLFSPWVGSMSALFTLGERLADEFDFTVVFKEHPSSRESYPELHQRCHERLLFANGNSTQELIERSLFVVTLNSTVGVESLLLGKSVLTLGNAFFNIEGLVAHADSLSELLRLAGEYPNWELDEELRCSFLHYLQHQYCVSGHWQEASVEHLQDVARRMQQVLLAAAI